MKRKLLLVLTSGIIIVGLIFFGNYWINTQPIWLVNSKVDYKILDKVPVKNKEVIYFIEANGRKIAPGYDAVVCTEFVIKIIDAFEPLTKEEKNLIRILTKEELGNLIRNDSSVIKGVQIALTKSNKGVEIPNSADVRPGDFVQFWNIYQGKEYGHCGIILDIDPNYSLTLYSSHPITDGYGKQMYLWPDKAYFVRLK
jgi:hypothetical protein